MAYSVNDVQAYLLKLERERHVLENEQRQQKINSEFDANKKKELEDKEKQFVDVVRNIQTVSPKAFTFFIKDVPTSNAVNTYFNDFLDLTAIMAAPPPINWFGLGGKFVGIISKLFSSQPSAAILDSQRLLVIQNNVNSLLLSAANDDKQFRIDKLNEAVALYKQVNTRLSNVYRAHPNLNGELYPWRNGGDETEETLLFNMRLLITNVFNINSRVWKSKFFPQDWDEQKIPWKNYIADLVPFQENTAKPPRNLDDVFDARITIDFFVEYIGLLLTMFTLRTPQFRSLGIYKNEILELVGILDYIISEYKKIYYFDTRPDAFWTGGSLSGGGKDFFPDSNPPNQWNFVAGQAGPAFGAVHPGMAVGVVNVINMNYYDYIHKSPRIPTNVEIKNNTYVDEFSREQLEIIMGVPTLGVLRTKLFELSWPPYKSETVLEGNADFWNNLWVSNNLKIPISVASRNFEGIPIVRRAEFWKEFSIAPQRSTSEFTDIPTINYNFFIESNGIRTRVEFGTKEIEIKTTCYNTVFVGESSFAIKENQLEYFNPDRRINLNPMPINEIDNEVYVSYTFTKIRDNNYQFKINTVKQNVNAVLSFVIQEILPINGLNFETKIDLLLMGNAIVVPDEVYTTLIGMVMHEANIRSKINSLVNFKVDKKMFEDDPFEDIYGPVKKNVDLYLSQEEYFTVKKEIDGLKFGRNISDKLFN